MAVNAQRIVNIILSGDVNVSLAFAAAANAASPGSVQRIDLISGTNTFIPPAGYKALTIIPPTTNVNSITLKVSLSDGVGVELSKVDLSSIAFGVGVTSLSLVTGGIILGVILIWT